MIPGSPEHPHIKQWVKALRSGRHQQTTGLLTRVTPYDVRHCCMGVGCHIARIKKAEGYGSIYYGETGQRGLPPVEFAEWLGFTRPERWNRPCVSIKVRGLGISGRTVKSPRHYVPLSALNDSKRWSFSQIADAIETYGVEVEWT